MTGSVTGSMVPGHRLGQGGEYRIHPAGVVVVDPVNGDVLEYAAWYSDTPIQDTIEAARFCVQWYLDRGIRVEREVRTGFTLPRPGHAGKEGERVALVTPETLPNSRGRGCTGGKERNVLAVPRKARKGLGLNWVDLFFWGMILAVLAWFVVLTLELLSAWR